MSKWNLEEFYKDEINWNNDLEKLKEYIDVFSNFKGKLGNFEDFLNYHKLNEESIKLFYRLYGYSHLASDLNLKDQEKAMMNQKVLIAVNKLSAATSWVNPEILNIGLDKILEFLQKDEILKPYEFGYRNLFRGQKHVLTNEQEQILANFMPVSSISSNLHQAAAIIDAKNETIKLSDKSKVEVNSSNFRALITNAKTSNDRKKIFEATFKRYEENKTIFASTYNLVLQMRLANYKSRNYKSALDAALFGNNIPLEVFHNLIDTAYENTNYIKKYINLRKKYLKIKNYATYDRFLNLANDTTKYDYETSRNLFFKAIENMDEEFVKMQHEALRDGFVDVYPQDGKRTGGYSSTLYGFHPFILLNHDYTLDSVFTLAHEAGHSAHSLFANSTQPMPISRYTIFVAEIASTFNEHVLLDYLLKTAKRKDEKINLLQKAIDSIMSTFFRQTLFAHYEFKAHELVKNGTPISAEVLSNIMVDLYKHYYDIDITKEKGKKYVWAYIPHLFHTPFYVYQYATSYSASLKIYEDIKNGKKDAFKNYKEMLKSGGSNFPIEQVKLAGCDLCDKETFAALIRRFKFLVDELEKILF